MKAKSSSKKMKTFVLVAIAVLIFSAFTVGVPTVSAQEYGSFSGEITDEVGDPIANGYVEFYGENGDDNEDYDDWTRTTETDENGEYHLEDVPVGTWDITADIWLYKPETVNDVEIYEDQETEDIDFELESWKGDIVGTVTDIDDNPIEDALVTIYEGEDEVANNTTDEDGNYEIELEPSTYDVTASHEDYKNHEKEDIKVNISETTTVDFNLVLGYYLTINVEGEGTTDPEPGTHTYYHGDFVTIKADPHDHSKFVNWTGDYPEGEQREEEITIYIDEDKELTANFAGMDYIDIEPKDYTIEAGDSVEYTAIAYNQTGEQVPVKLENVTVETNWYIYEDDHSEYWEDNVYRPEVVGEWTVNASYEYHGEFYNESTNLTVLPGEVNYTEINPSENQTIKAGEELEFTAVAYDKFSNIITENATEFKWENIDEENVTEDVAMFSETKPGEYNVTATYKGVRSEVIIVTVELGEVETVEIEPKPEATIEVGEELVFSAWANDTEGNVITDNVDDFKWQNATDGLFEIDEPGEYNVTAEFENVTSDPTRVRVTEFFELTVEYNATQGSVKVEGKPVDPGSRQTYENGSIVELEAISRNGFVFENWTVNDEFHSKENVTNIKMDEDKSVFANFEKAYNLTVEYNATRGSVEVDGEEVDPGWIREYPVGTTVNLEAISREGFVFENWTVNDEFHSEENVTNITIEDDKTVIANFGESNSLTVEYNATRGSVEVDGEEVDPGWIREYLVGTTVNLEAISTEGFVFENWTVNDEFHSEENMTSINMDEDKEITAVFEEEPLEEYDLTINIDGEGTTDPEEGTHTYEEGTEVTVEATPAEGWEFVEWTGDYESEEAEITFEIVEDMEITAHFEEEVVVETYELTINIDGEGTVTVEWDDEEVSVTDEETFTIDEDTQITLMAEADVDWQFVKWTGDREDTDEEITITMDDDYHITAIFEEVIVEEPYFEVEITAYDEEVKETDTVTVEFKVLNSGEVQGIQNISFMVDGEKEDTIEMTIGVNETKEGEFTWEAEEEGEYELVVQSEDTSDSVTVTVEEEDWHDWLCNLWWLWLILLVIWLILLLIILALIFYFWKRTLTIEEIEGEGKVYVNREEVTELPHESDYTKGSEVELIGEPDEGWEFVRWTGVPEEKEEDLNILLEMDSDKTVTAIFESDEGSEEDEVEIERALGDLEEALKEVDEETEDISFVCPICDAEFEEVVDDCPECDTSFVVEEEDEDEEEEEPEEDEESELEEQREEEGADDGEDDDEDDTIPRFTTMLLVLGAVIAVAIYHKKEQ